MSAFLKIQHQPFITIEGIDVVPAQTVISPQKKLPITVELFAEVDKEVANKGVAP
jgi:hypothetical protein